MSAAYVPPSPICVMVDTDTMETVAHRHGLTIEIADQRAHLELDGIHYIAELQTVS